MKKLASLQITVFIVLILLSCANKNDPMLARVGNHRITLSQFERSYRQGKAMSLIRSSTANDFRDHLEKMVNERLKLLYAYTIGYDTLSAFDKYVNAETERALNSRYIEKNVIDAIISESDLRDLYRKTSVQVKARHILLRVPPDADAQSVEAVRKKAEQLRTRIKKGESFAEIAKQYSEDNITGPHGGALGTVKWGGVGYNDAFYNEMFKLRVGEVSSPVRSNKGYHLIVLDDTKIVNTSSYAAVKDDLKRELLTRKQKESQQKYLEVLQDLRWKYRVRIDSAQVMVLIDKVKEAHENLGQRRTSVDRTIDEFYLISAEQEKLRAVTFIGGDITIGNIIFRLRGINPNKRPRLYMESEAYIWLDGLINLRLVLHEAKAIGLHKDKSLREGRKEYLERLMLRRIDNEMIRNKVSLPEETLNEYYEAHKENYYHESQYKVQEILIAEEETALQVLARARAGEDFNRLARQYTERASFKEKDGVLGFITDKQFGQIGPSAVSLNVGEISGLIPMGRKHSIVKLIDKIESKPKTFAEARVQVIRDVRRLQERQIEATWLHELEERFGARKHEEHLALAYADILED